MTLAEYMGQQGLKDTDLAQLCGRDRTRISRIRRGLDRPSLELAAKIERLTRGRVTALDFCPEAA